MLVDSNLLIYSVSVGSQHQAAAESWLRAALAGPTLVGMPWISLAAFLRITTSARIFPEPLQPSRAWSVIESWLQTDVVWIPGPAVDHARVLGRLIRAYDLRANLVTDAQLAAIAIEHGLTVYSTDTDFARCKEVRWINPIA